MIETAFFYIFSAVLVFSALMVITARNPVHSVLFLILAFFNAAGLFMMLGAEFIAMIMVIVYVGAVAVLFLFVVMMLDINFADLRKGMKKYAPTGAIIGGILLGEFITMFMTWGGSSSKKMMFPMPANMDNSYQMKDVAPYVSNTSALGELIYTHYVYIFQVSGLILLTAMVGAIVLTHRERPSTKHQDISAQLNRQPKDVIRIEKIASGAGVS